ncbi:hypothetical protein N0V90_001150 [Kalmusia sp. IMI 367209]|nr:hypothetical protein N0V90_001150 [Kalmusia sp. IMI 367209]
MSFNLQDFDKHIASLRSQLHFLNEVLEGTDHNAPDWLATDLISLRNKSGRLQDDMQRFRDQLQSEGLAETKASTSNKRLSLEGAKRPVTEHDSAQTPPPKTRNPPPSSRPQPQPQTQSKDEYKVQHIDVTEEVNRRLRESRLRRLMDSPSTSQKRKYDALEGVESGGDTEGDQEDVWQGRSPMKKIRASGSFEPIAAVMKRKENGASPNNGGEGQEDRNSFKRRKR